jgi:hypothetical protein
VSRYKVLKDCEGIELKSSEAFKFACCDCGLVHNIVVVSQDSKSVGFAVKRNKRATTFRRRNMGNVR